MDVLTVLKFVAALALVLSLIGGCAFIASRLNLVSNLTRAGNKRRMEVVESLVLDAKHRMMIVKSDDREHVLLFGPSGDLVVESRDAHMSASTDDASTIVPLMKEAGA